MCSIASSLAGGGGHPYTSSSMRWRRFANNWPGLCKLGFRIFGIAPGAVKTTAAVLAQALQQTGWLRPIKRWIEPESGRSQSLLAQWKASAMQGQILTIDGGWSLK